MRNVSAMRTSVRRLVRRARAFRCFARPPPNLSVRAPRLRAALAADTSGARRAGVKLKVVYRPNRGDERSSKFEN